MLTFGGGSQNLNENNGKTRKRNVALLIVGIALVVVIVVATSSSRGSSALGEVEKGASAKRVAVATAQVKKFESTVDLTSESRSGFDFSRGLALTPDMPRSKEIAFEVSLMGKNAFKSGENVMAVFKATNVGQKRIRMSTFHLPTSRFMVNGDAQLHGQGLMHLTFENCRTSLCQEKWMGARVLKRAPACADDGSGLNCVTLKPGESIETKFDLAKYYSLARSGVYTFQVGGPLAECVDADSNTKLNLHAISNAVSFRHVNVERSVRVKTAMELGSLHPKEAEQDAASQHIFAAAKDSVLLAGTYVTPHTFGRGATIDFDVQPTAAGKVAVSLNGLIRLEFTGQTVSAVQDGTDSGTVSASFPQFSSILATSGSHHVSLEVLMGGYSLTIDGICRPSEAPPATFACPKNILAVVDDSPTSQYGQQVTVVVSGATGGTTLSNLAVSGGSVLRRRLGTGCGAVNVQLYHNGCGTSNTESLNNLGLAITHAAQEIKNRNLRSTLLFGTSSDWSEVDWTFQNMADALCQTNSPIQSVTFACKTDCTYFAYVYSAQTNNLVIYLCTAFYSAPVTGYNSKMGTVVHELSHFNQIGATDDHAYGCTNAKSLSDAQKRNNADNFEYVIEGSC